MAVSIQIVILGFNMVEVADFRR